MSLLQTRKIFVVAAIAAVTAAPLGALPALAQDGVTVTIRKAPSYLNTRTTPNPGSSSRAAYDTSALYQSVAPVRNSIAFGRSPLPSTFDIPGY